MIRSWCRRGLPLALLALLGMGACGPRGGGGVDGGVGSGDGGSDGGSVDGGGTETRVRVATLNTHLFFDTVCESRQCGAGDFEALPSQAAFEAKARTLADGIAGLGASVVALQEVETQASLDALVADLPGRFTDAVLGETGRAGSLDVALVASLPILGVRRHRDRVLVRPDGTHTTFTRELLEVHLQTDGGRLIVLVAHFRSKWQDDPGRREAEATATGQILAELASEWPDATIVLAGDLNDVPGSKTLRALEAEVPLERVAAELHGAETTFVYQGSAYALDHIYWVSSAGGHYQPGSAEVERDGPRGYAGSDHAALRADFDLP